MSVKYGFIGTGNMGGALALALSKKVEGNEILLANKTSEKAQKLADQIGAGVADNHAVASQCEFIYLGVKPQMMADMLKEIQDDLKRRKDIFVLVSMAAALTTRQIEEMAGGSYPVIRIMPNTPVAVGEGIIMYCYNDAAKRYVSSFVEDLSFAGIVDEIEEAKIDAGSAVAGCGPAFADLFMEALADGAVSCGIPRAKAYKYAEQMLLGTAKLALETGKHPGVLKDEVCSPGGSTIAGVAKLEENGFRSAVLEAVKASYKRTKEMG